jgi:chorismate mutase
LAAIAETLEGLEETIIVKLIDRAQFSRNSVIYQPGMSGFAGEPSLSLFELRMLYQERMDAEFGRFCVPEERPFCEDLPAPKRSVNLPATGLAIADLNHVNLTPRILRAYLDLIPRLCREGSDGHYGSSVEHDVYAIQAVARRIHYGAFYVAESKYQESEAAYRAMIDRGDRAAIMSSLTRAEVEERIVARVREKTEGMQSRVNARVRHVVDPAVVVEFYLQTVIPLTKEGEVQYLLQRRQS